MPYVWTKHALRVSNHLSKVVYGGMHWRWLLPDHPFCFNVNVLSTEEVKCEPAAMNASSHIQWAFMQVVYTQFGGWLRREGDPVFCSGVKRLPMLYTLPY